MRKAKLVSIAETIKDFFDLPLLLTLGLFILLIFLLVDAAHRPVEKAPPPTKIPRVARMIVSDTCDDACFDHWRAQLQFVSVCGTTHVDYDPSKKRRVIWLGKSHDRYRELSADANIELTCIEEGK